MLDALLDDGLNPRFVTHIPIFLDELDPLQRLSPQKLAAHIAEAIDRFHASQAEDCDAVRDLVIEHLNPVIGTGTLRVDIWLESLDAATCLYGFLCSTESGGTPYARGERTLMKLDANRRPSTWSRNFLDRHSSLLKTLHAYA